MLVLAAGHYSSCDDGMSIYTCQGQKLRDSLIATTRPCLPSLFSASHFKKPSARDSSSSWVLVCQLPGST